VTGTRMSGLAAALALLVALLAPAGASAHATLEDTQPARGATVRSQPATVQFRFDESVEGNFGAVRVFDRSGRRVDSGDAFHPGGRGAVMAVHLKPGLPRGTYTAMYRVVSADGHIVSSGFTFSIGRASGTSDTVAQLLGGTGSGPVTDVLFGIARGVQFAAIGIGVGGVLFLLIVWLPALASVAGAGREWREASEAFRARLRTLLLAAAGAGVVSAAAAVVLEGASAAAVSGWSALRLESVNETLGTRFGTVWGLAVLVWSGVAALSALVLAPAERRSVALHPAELGATGLAGTRVPRPPALLGLGVLLAFLVALPSLGGHASTQHPVGVLLPANLVHVTAMSLWLGGLTALVAALPAATRRLAGADRTRLLAAALVRFSPLALAAVIALLLTGVIQALVEVRTVAHLFDTAFGRCVLIKIGLLVALIGLGAYNRRQSVPRLRALADAGVAPGRAGLLLRRALRAEVALIAVVLAVTAALSAYAPSIAVASGPVSRTATVGPAQLQMTVDPARVGANEIHLYLIDPRSGAQFDRAKEVDVDALQSAKGIGPLREPASKAGPGHYVVPSALLGVPGTWSLRVTVRVSDFDEFESTVTVPIR
jgi:copper transport protein